MAAMTRIGTFVLAALISGGSAFALMAGDSSFPDPKLTPGAVASTDVREVCGHEGGLSYSKRHRVWTEKADTMRKYGLPLSRSREFEDDDRVPVCAGGDNTSPLNHWAQPWPEAHKKDRIEAQVCRAICHGAMTLEQGQAIFLGDWRGYLK